MQLHEGNKGKGYVVHLALVKVLLLSLKLGPELALQIVEHLRNRVLVSVLSVAHIYALSARADVDDEPQDDCHNGYDDGSPDQVQH